MTARIIKASVRNIDIVTRYGGEEFAVILPVTQTTAAEDIAERIRVGIASQDGPVKPLGNIIRLTASLGIACFPGDADNLNDLVENADRALYLAKLGGKNRVVIFDKVPSVKRTEEFLC